jgi:hypothetical protein
MNYKWSLWVIQYFWQLVLRVALKERRKMAIRVKCLIFCALARKPEGGEQPGDIGVRGRKILERILKE